jgi:hypothetical protein
LQATRSQAGVDVVQPSRPRTPTAPDCFMSRSMRSDSDFGWHRGQQILNPVRLCQGLNVIGYRMSAENRSHVRVCVTNRNASANLKRATMPLNKWEFS